MKINEVLMQRCLDGELSPSEQIEFIKKLESDESCQGWRKLALEFLEEQTFRSNVVALAQKEQEVADHQSADSPPGQKNAKEPVAGKGVQSKSDNGSRRILPLVAASLFIGLISGSFGGRMFPGSSALQDPELAGSGFVQGNGTMGAEEASRIDAQSSPVPINELTSADGTERFHLVPVNTPNGIQYVPVRFGEMRQESVSRLWDEHGLELGRSPSQFRVRNRQGHEAVVPGFRVLPAVQ